ncbi:MAG: NAD(P)/FAD-dependent oxidoreductase [Lachnospiraceae bacterium]|nr:NAD(P)/FAD-dependent oxidoreductase [Lachnospiraceae bacterium]
MNTCVVGGGAAGMMAAVFAARCGDEVTLIEKNEKLGKKVYITGKGRCNLTNDCDDEVFFDSVITNPKFLYSAYYSFPSSQVMSFFEELGLKIKTERGNRVFPQSDHSSDVIGALKRELNRLSVDIKLNTKVLSINVNDCGECVGVTTKSGDIKADKVILATGGKSYKACGADGDSWRFAEALGIDTKPAEPSLVPFVTKEDFVIDLQGLSLKNVSIKLCDDNKTIYDGFGEMLFTHFGVSGPLILTASTHVREKQYQKGLKLLIDLKPAMSEKELDERVLRDFKAYSNKQFINALSDLLPSKMIPVVVDLSGIDSRKIVNVITKEERLKLVHLLKNLELTVVGNRGFDEAIITRGGISTKEINPSTMESKKYKGLYFAGEMIDVDALTGGFNLQIAWSSAYLAAQNY